MTPLEIELRLSLIRGELLKLADGLDGRAARIVRYAASVLTLLASRKHCKPALSAGPVSEQIHEHL